MATFFTADPHFGHANIIKYANRPFTSPEQMDAKILERWNMMMGAEDTLYCLGDWCVGVGRDKAAYAGMIRARLLVGTVHLIRGNHDPRPGASAAFDAVFTSVREFAQIKLAGTKLPVTLCHYALMVWEESHHGAFHLFGHSHGTLSHPGRAIDVGVDTHNFMPYSEDHVRRLLLAKPFAIIDHHTQETT